MGRSVDRGARPELPLLGEFLSRELGELSSRHARLDLSSHVLGWFEDAERNVPAYSRFLAERGVDPARIKR